MYVCSAKGIWKLQKKVRILVATYKNVPKKSFKFSCHFQLWCMLKNCLKNENRSTSSPQKLFSNLSRSKKGDVYCV